MKRRVRERRPGGKREARVTPARRRSSGVRQIQAALAQFERAQGESARRGTELLRCADSLGAAAVAVYQDGLIRRLLDRQYLRDLLALDGLLKRDSGTLSPELRSMQTLPGSILRWLAEEFGLSPHLQSGAEVEIPVSDLAGFDVPDEAPRDRGQLVRVRVEAPGWKRAGRTVMRPQGRIVG